MIAMKQNADKKLARRVLDGDRRAFDAFFNTYYPRLYRFALVRLNRDHDLADETAQVVLCQAISKLSTYRGEAPLFSWLCTFCRYELARQRKAVARAQGDTPLREDDPAVRAALESLLSVSTEAPDAAVEQADIARLVTVALDYLPSLYADALEYKYVQGLSVRDIARRIGKSAKATESTLTRARAAFRDSFKTLMQSDGDPTGELSSILE